MSTTLRSKIQAGLENNEELCEHSVYVGNITDNMTDAELQAAFFEVFGPASMYGRSSPPAHSFHAQKLGFSFFKFDTKLACQKAVQKAELGPQDLLMVRSRALFVRRRESRAQRDQRHFSSPRKPSFFSSSDRLSSSPRKEYDGHKSSRSRNPHANGMARMTGETIPIPTWYHSDIILVNNLPMEMTPKQLFEFFQVYSPVAAYIYPEVDNYFLQRIGEVQFSDGTTTKKALTACQDAVIAQYHLHATYRPVRFAKDDEYEQIASGIKQLVSGPNAQETPADHAEKTSSTDTTSPISVTDQKSQALETIMQAPRLRQSQNDQRDKASVKRARPLVSNDPGILHSVKLFDAKVKERLQRKVQAV